MTTRVFATFFAFLLIGAACSSDEPTPAGAVDTTAPIDESAQGTVLLTISSDGGGIEGSLLLLDPLVGEVLWFTDSPDRQAGVIPVADLIDRWTEFGFTDNPPNAAILDYTAAGGVVAQAVELSDPAYDETQATLSFTVTPLEGQVPFDFNGAFSIVIDDSDQITLNFINESNDDPGDVVVFKKDEVTNPE